MEQTMPMAGPGAGARGASTLRAWRVLIRYVTVLLPAIFVFGAEVIRHEWLHGFMPEMLGNVVTGTIALGISALILIPVYRRLDDTDARLRVREIEHAVTEERERLARELHDGVSQALFFLNIKTTALERALAFPNDLDAARQVAGEIAQTIGETSGRVRDAIFDLRTGPEPGKPFVAWVRTYMHRFSEIHALSGTVEEVGTPVDIPLERELHAMAIIREALDNVVKHARAESVRLRIEWGPREVRITVADDGRGLPDPVSGPAQGRYGLVAMQEHAGATGGTAKISSSAGGGGSVVFTVLYPHGDSS